MIHRRTRAIALTGAAALAVPLLAATATGSGAFAAPPARTAHHARVALRDSQPAWATAARQVGRVPAGHSIAFQVQLRLRHEASAVRTARAVSTPGSSRFHRYLSSRQFAARFAPSSRTVRGIEGFLRGHGIAVTGVAGQRRAVEARASAAVIESVFHTSLGTYRYDGHILRAARSALVLPARYARSVLAVTGVNQRPVHARPLSRVAGHPRPAVNVADYRCSTYWNQFRTRVPVRAYGRRVFPNDTCGYTPGQIQGAYGLKPLYHHGQRGQGTKVAIIDAYASPTIREDANTYAARHHQPQFKAGQFTQKTFRPFQHQTACGGAPGWWGEETLDVESVHTMAPGADVLYLGAKDCDAVTGDYSLEDAQAYVVDNFDHQGSPAYGVSIVSNSYGVPGEELESAADIAVAHRIAVQAAAEGIGFYFSSGDDGDNVSAGAPTPQPTYEASDPFVTAVGGTSLLIGKHQNYLRETGWGDDRDYFNTDADGNLTTLQEPLPGDFYGGAGGGVSHLFDEPSYQRGVVPAALARSYDGTPQRVVPDVSLDADPYTGVLVGETDPTTGVYGELTYGGTSVASPLMAGLQAVAQGAGAPIGFANPVLYRLPRGAYHDAKSPGRPLGADAVTPRGAPRVTFDRDTSLTTTPGYDDVTGRGSPRGYRFVAAERHRVR